MNRGEVFVIAITANGKPGSVNVLDLDDESFRAWVLSRFILAGLVTWMDNPQGEKIVLKERVSTEVTREE